MIKLALRITFAIVAFGLGVLTNGMVNTLSEPLINPAVYVIDFARTNFVDDDVLTCPPMAHCCFCLMVRVDENRNVYLASEPMGGLSDVRYLKSRLEDIFEIREAQHFVRVPLRLDEPVPQRQEIERTVLIKAAPSIPYGEILKLIAAVKEAGAQPVGFA